MLVRRSDGSVDGFQQGVFSTLEKVLQDWSTDLKLVDDIVAKCDNTNAVIEHVDVFSSRNQVDSKVSISEGSFLLKDTKARLLSKLRVDIEKDIGMLRELVKRTDDLRLAAISAKATLTRNSAANSKQELNDVKLDHFLKLKQLFKELDTLRIDKIDMLTTDLNIYV